VAEWPAGALGGASDALNYIKEPSTTLCKDLPASVPLNGNAAQGLHDRAVSALHFLNLIYPRLCEQQCSCSLLSMLKVVVAERRAHEFLPSNSIFSY
jgi:hypothetical protein